MRYTCCSLKTVFLQYWSFINQNIFMLLYSLSCKKNCSFIVQSSLLIIWIKYFKQLLLLQTEERDVDESADGISFISKNQVTNLSKYGHGLFKNNNRKKDRKNFMESQKIK